MNADKTIVQKDIKELYLGNANTVEFDLELPLSGKNGSQISWESDAPHICDAQGKVTRPAYGKGNREVTLKACFRHGGYQEETSVKITVLEEKSSLKIAEVYPVQKRAFVGEGVCLPGAVAVKTEDGRVIAREVCWDQGAVRRFEHPGSYQVKGKLCSAGTEVRCEVTVAPKNRQEAEHCFLQPGQDRDPWEVRLTAGSDFHAAQERLHRWLLGTDCDQWLYNFRKAAGLDLRGAPAMTGWDSPDGLLRGHSTGHYLSALALCYHATGDEEILKKSQVMVEGLWECRQAFERRDGFHRGFLSAYSEEQFDLLEQYTPYPVIWAPYYTLHKILAGLIDLSRLTGSGQAADLGVPGGHTF